MEACRSVSLSVVVEDPKEKRATETVAWSKAVLFFIKTRLCLLKIREKSPPLLPSKSQLATSKKTTASVEESITEETGVKSSKDIFLNLVGYLVCPNDCTTKTNTEINKINLLIAHYLY